MAVAAALGASVPSLADWFDRVYGVREDHKFITEGVPTGLIPMSEIDAAAGVKTPAIDALVQMVRNMTGKNFAADARTLGRLGLAGMDERQIRRVVEKGFD